MKNKIILLLKKFYLYDSYRVKLYYLLLQNILKVNSKVILYESHHGNSMTCNPYAIYLYMVSNDKFKKYTHIWILSDTKNIEKRKNTKYIKRNSLQNAYYLLVSKYLVNNTTFLPFFKKNEKQIYINTWHGTPLKTLGKDSGLGYNAGWNLTKNILQTDFIISPNKYTTEIFLSSTNTDTLYSGQIIENGYPRNDFLLLSDSEKEDLRKKLNINNNKKTILYAPTFRGNHSNAENYNDIFVDFILNLSKFFSSEYNILIKLHHINSTKDINITNVPDNIDTNKLLSIVDILITDYSSIAFDFLALKRPIIYYAFDLAKYSKDRGFYYDFHKMAGVICEKEQEVYDAINNIEKLVDNHIESYNDNIEKFAKYEDGNVTHKIVEVIFLNNKKDTNIYSLKENGKKKMLIYGGGFMLNGVTVSILSLLSNISYEKYEVYIITNLSSNNINMKRVLSQIPKEVKILYIQPVLLKFTLKIAHLLPINLKEKMFKNINYGIFGNSKFDIAIDYSGYTIYWASIIAYSNSLKKYIYLHSDMIEETKKGRFLDFDNIFDLYKNKFDKLISVSFSSYEANKLAMPEVANKIDVVHNSIDASNIITLSKEEEFSKEKTNFITIGRYSVEKGQDNLIKAFALLCEEYSNLHLYIVGHGPLHAKLNILINRLNMKKNITLTGKMDNPYNLLAKCDCFVLPSHYEGQGLVLLESLVLKVPCIATNIPGPNSILSDGQGLLVPDSIDGLKDGMQSYLKGEVAYKEFDYKKYTNDSMEEFYKNII